MIYGTRILYSRIGRARGSTQWCLGAIEKQDLWWLYQTPLPSTVKHDIWEAWSNLAWFVISNTPDKTAVSTFHLWMDTNCMLSFNAEEHSAEDFNEKEDGQVINMINHLKILLCPTVQGHGCARQCGTQKNLVWQWSEVHTCPDDWLTRLKRTCWRTSGISAPGAVIAYSMSPYLPGILRTMYSGCSYIVFGVLYIWDSHSPCVGNPDISGQRYLYKVFINKYACLSISSSFDVQCCRLDVAHDPLHWTSWAT